MNSLRVCFRFLWPTVVVYLAPWIYLHKHVLARLHCSNDFYVLYFAYKAYLLDFWNVNGNFPLWSPTEGGGLSFVFNPFTQSFYPLNFLLKDWVAFSLGYSELEYHWYAVFGLSIFGIGMYRWLRARALPVHVSVISAIIAVLSFKMTELMRFPNAIHAAAWFPWILWACTRSVQNFRVWQRAGIALLLSFFLFSLSTAGYPYFLMYLPFLLAPYVILLVWENGVRGSMKGAITVALGLGFGLVAVLPYLMKVRQFLSMSVDRGTPNFEYASSGGFTPLNTLGSWLYPPVSMHEGWYFFGTAVAVVILTSFKNIRHSPYRKPLLVFLGALLFTTLFTWTHTVPLFRWVWHSVPVFQTLRYWSRMNVVLVPWVALALSYGLMTLLEKALKSTRLTMLVTSGGIVAVQIAVRLFAEPHSYWTNYVGASSAKEWSFIVLTAVSVPLLIFALRFSRKAFLMAVLVISLMQLYPVGAVQWSVLNFDFFRNYRWTMSLTGDSGMRSARDLRQQGIASQKNANFGLSSWANWGYETHIHQILPYMKSLEGGRAEGVSDAEWAAFLRFYAVSVDPQEIQGKVRERVFFLSRFEHPDLVASLKDHDRSVSRGFRANVISFNGDALELEVVSPDPGFLVYVDNWDPDWVVEIEGVPAPLLKYRNAYKTVELSSGTHRVKFSYEPFGKELSVRTYFGSLARKVK